ncbi:sugar translocase [Halobacteriales archaeon QH_8_64_26]|nr:MAG: sugar translocase [Halobacteriales archaeon QH_8_64_26]
MDRHAPDSAGSTDHPGSSGPAEHDPGVETDGSGATHSPGALPGNRGRDATGRTGGAHESEEPRLAGVRRRAAALQSGVRLGQFLSIGVLGALFDNGLLVVLYGLGSVPLGIAKFASAEAAILLMFVCNERVTFAEWGAGGNRDLARRVLTSNLVRLGGVLVATGVLLVLAELGVWYVLANVIGIGVGALLNYVLESLLTWRVHRE